MAVRSWGYIKRDVMNLFFLGCLSLYVVTTPVDCVQSDLDSTTSGFTQEYHSIYNNCTQCSPKLKECRCMRQNDSCSICCPTEESNNECCYCYATDCSPCRRRKSWQLLTMMQISISILFGFGIVGLIIIYCKICRRTRQIARERCAMLQQEEQETMYCSTIEGLRERPPPYSQVCGAPPIFMASRNGASSLYAILYNRACMQEAPPSYPETPKPRRERLDGSGEPASSLSSVPNSIQHL